MSQNTGSPPSRRTRQSSDKPPVLENPAESGASVDDGSNKTVDEADDMPSLAPYDASALTVLHTGVKNRKEHLVAFKLEVVRHAKETKNIAGTARHFTKLGQEVDRSSVRAWLKDEDKLKKAELTKSRLSGAGRKPKHPQFDADLAKWVSDSQASGRRLTQYIITEYAKDMAWARRIYDLKFSESWWESFRKRHKMDLRNIVITNAAGPSATMSEPACSTLADALASVASSSSANSGLLTSNLAEKPGPSDEYDNGSPESFTDFLMKSVEMFCENPQNVDH